jgi:hypothetical protein
MQPELEEQLEYELEEEFEAIGESGWEEEFEDPAWPTWPPGRRFDPGPLTTIPSGPFKTSPRLPCERLKLDAADLRDSLSNLNRSLALMDRIKSVKPRDQQTWGEITRRVEKERDSVEAAMRGMIQRLRTRSYNIDGCTKGPRGHFAQVTEQVRNLRLQGGWERIPYKKDPATGDFVENLRRLRDILVFLLRKSR